MSSLEVITGSGRRYVVVPAVRKALPARLAIVGPSGSGKTFTALTFATGLAADAGPVVVVDTQKGQALDYAPADPNAQPGAGEFAFHHLRLDDGYSPEIIPELLAQFASDGFSSVVIDSFSSFWSGTGGMLELVDSLTGPRGDKYNTGWNKAAPIERRMIDALMAYPGHVIVTMRVKTDVVMEQNAAGKTVPRKVGLKPDQRDKMDYEFGTLIEMDMDHTARVSKTTCPALADQSFPRPGPDVARLYGDWLSGGGTSPSLGSYVERAYARDVTLDGLEALGREVAAAGLAGAAVLDATGETRTMQDLVRRRWREVKAADARPQAVPAQAGAA